MILVQPHLLNLVNLSRRTGMLTIFEAIPTGEQDAMKNEKMAAGAERAKVAFNKGKLVYATFSEQEGGLVAVLNKAGKLTDDQAKGSQRTCKANTSDKALAMRSDRGEICHTSRYCKLVSNNTFSMLSII